MVSTLEAANSVLKEQVNEQRDLSRARSNQVHHVLGQLEEQNIFYRSHIAEEREKAERTETRLYHVVRLLPPCRGLVCVANV